ncbi:MAG: class I SAM-dependent methyltransferase [Phycisphaeraceae bacterium]|nr:class I SAM-dependent methyltransferase [Phycisphaeraceae bacterium]
MCMQHAGANRALSTDEFGARFLGWLNGGAIMLMISVGHRTGLLDAMGRLGGKPATSADIAFEAGLSERYVREWLGAMVTGGVVLHKRDDGTYVLPAEHAALLTRASSPNNLAGTAQWLSVLGSVEDLVVEAFRHGKGISYEAYGERFHDVMAEESNQTTIGGLDEHILPLVPGLVERLEHGARVVDVGCGKGLAMVHLAARFPRSEFQGVDLSRVAIEAGMREASSRGLGNVRLVTGDVTSFGQSGEFDLVTAFDAIHDQSRPAEVLANIRRILRPGGLFLMQDIRARSAVADNMDLPLGPFTYTISCMHCMSVSLAGGGPGLGAAWGKELALSMLEDAGFREVSVHELPHDIINLYYVCAG